MDPGVFRKGKAGILGCPEGIDDWSFWNEDTKKWEFEKASLFANTSLYAKCDSPPSSEGEHDFAEVQFNNLKSTAGNDGSTVEKGKIVTKYQLYQHVCNLQGEMTSSMAMVRQKVR